MTNYNTERASVIRSIIEYYNLHGEGYYIELGAHHLIVSVKLYSWTSRRHGKVGIKDAINFKIDLQSGQNVLMARAKMAEALFKLKGEDVAKLEELKDYE